ncbi:uncharacterized protein [Rutidosis leptorrhynchoides]|uniref:uncharacterized protein n=1 Tax=Rutidosis leptorrhynchoides TaxID=125765 RepID=UPI003A99C5D7
MSNRSGGGGGGGVPPAFKKMVQSLMEIVNGVPEAEIYSTLKECNMDPNEAVNRLLSQDTFHEVKSKREKKKELKDTTDFRPRASSSNRGARSGTDRYAGRSGSTHFGSSESGGSYVNPAYKKDNRPSSYAASTTPASRVAPLNSSDNPGLEKAPSTISAADSASVSQPSSGYQSAWGGAPGQKSMADIVKMGRPQTKVYTTSNSSQPSISHNVIPEITPECDASPENDWPSIEQPPAVNLVDTVIEPGFNDGQSNVSFDRSNEYLEYETNKVQPQDESSSEDDVENDDVQPASVTEQLYDNGTYRNVDSYHPHNDTSDHKEELDSPISSVSASIQKLNVQEEEHVVPPKEDVPSVIIPNHLQVHTADCSHLSFGSFGANLNTGFSRPSSVEQSETTNIEYYEDGPTTTLSGTENYELPSASQNAVSKQDDREVTHGGQSQYGFQHNPRLLDPSFTQSQTPQQTQMSTPFLTVMAAANGNSIRESDPAYSQFSVSQSMPNRYANSASSITDPTISMAEALKTIGLSPSQPQQQNVPAGSAVPHLTMHPYSQPTLPLGPFANMIGYPFLPQSYTYMPSGFQPAYAGNSTYHQQLAAMLPQYKNNVSASSLPQSANVASGYGSFGVSTAVPGNYQVSQPSGPAGSTISYEDLLNAQYKDSSHLLSLQQNENSPMWVHGGGSRTMPPVPPNAFYTLQSQNLQQQPQPPSGFRQGQQPSQGYGAAALNYPDFFHSQSAMSQEQHQLQQNSRDGSLGGGSQGQPKLQSQQLWQNGY